MIAEFYSVGGSEASDLETTKVSISEHLRIIYQLLPKPYASYISRCTAVQPDCAGLHYDCILVH